MDILEGAAMSNDVIEMNPVVGERSRTYHFDGGEKLTIWGVTHLCVRPSGNHRLRDGNGKLWLVADLWNAIEIDADDWSL